VEGRLPIVPASMRRCAIARLASGVERAATVGAALEVAGAALAVVVGEGVKLGVVRPLHATSSSVSASVARVVRCVGAAICQPFVEGATSRW